MLNGVVDDVLNGVVDDVLNGVVDDVLNGVVDDIWNGVVDDVWNGVVSGISNGVVDDVWNGVAGGSVDVLVIKSFVDLTPMLIIPVPNKIASKIQPPANRQRGIIYHGIFFILVKTSDFFFIHLLFMYFYLL